MHWELCAWSGCSHRLAGLGFACPLCRCRLQNHVIGIVVIVAEIIIVVVPTLLLVRGLGPMRTRSPLAVGIVAVEVHWLPQRCDPGTYIESSLVVRCKTAVVLQLERDKVELFTLLLYVPPSFTKKMLRKAKAGYDKMAARLNNDEEEEEDNDRMEEVSRRRQCCCLIVPVV